MRFEHWQNINATTDLFEINRRIYEKISLLTNIILTLSVLKILHINILHITIIKM